MIVKIYSLLKKWLETCLVLSIMKVYNALYLNKMVTKTQQSLKLQLFYVFFFFKYNVVQLIRPNFNCIFINLLSHYYPFYSNSISVTTTWVEIWYWRSPSNFVDGPIILPRISPIKTQNPAIFQKLAPFTLWIWIQFAGPNFI